MGMRLPPDIEAKAMALAGGQGRTAAPAPPDRWVVTIDRWHPTSVNTLLRTSPYKRGALKKQDALIVAAECFKAGASKATGRRKVDVRIQWQRGCPPDPDNVNKVLRDALKSCGMIVDDSAKWATFTETEVVRGKKATVVTIEDVAGGFQSDAFPALPETGSP